MNRLTDTENRLVVAMGMGWGGMAGESGVSRYKLLHMGRVRDQVYCMAKETIFN